MTSPQVVSRQEPGPIHLCGRPLGDIRHICAFVNSREEEYRILAPFVKEGLENGEKVSQIIDVDHTHDHEARLSHAGVQVEQAKSRGAYGTLGWEQTYVKDGVFDTQRMLEMLEAVIIGREAEGYARGRVSGNMEWILRGSPGSEYALEFETRVNFIAPKHPDVFVCVYDINKFGSATLMDLMRTHPAVILGGIYHVNPYYVPPELMLDELIQRGKAKRA